MKERILKILSESEDYLSGEKLSKELGVSRTAVWKAVKRLREEGYEIDSVRNKGYRLVNDTTELVGDAVMMVLPKDSIFKTVKVYDSLDSTNSEGKRLWQQGNKECTLIISREQTQGKGRRGRTWLSPRDKGIFMTMLLTPDIEPVHASMLTLVAGLAVSKAIEKMTALKPMIKWPNDLVLNGKKVCGILTEMSAEVDYVHYVLVGTGINVNQSVFDPVIQPMATSVAEVWGKELSRPALIGEVLMFFESLYRDFLVHKDLSYMKEAYNSRCINVDSPLRIIKGQEDIKGTGLGITDMGQLRVRLEDGSVTEVHSGEVSVRGLYGYV